MAQYMYLNKSAYTKDGERKCYVQLADRDGNVVTMNASSIPDNEFPVKPFVNVDVDVSFQQFGRNTALRAESIKEVK